MDKSSCKTQCYEMPGRPKVTRISNQALSTTVGRFNGHFKMCKIAAILQYKSVLQLRCFGNMSMGYDRSSLSEERIRQQEVVVNVAVG